MGDATGEYPPFDEILVTDVALLGNTDGEVQKRLAEIGVRVRVADGSQEPGDSNTPWTPTGTRAITGRTQRSWRTSSARIAETPGRDPGILSVKEFTWV